MRGVMGFNVHAHSVAAPMLAAAAQQSHYDHNNLHQQQQLHNNNVHQEAPHSPWRSPVPYLFGGLAAMLGLIAFALLILACSYWKLSGYLEGGEGGGRDGDVESGQQQGAEKGSSSEKVAADFYEQKIVVIMAGDVKPTYLATPIASRNNSFGDDGKADKGVKAAGEEEVGVSGGADDGKVEGSGDTEEQQAAPAAAASKDGENSDVVQRREEEDTSSACTSSSSSQQEERTPQ